MSGILSASALILILFMAFTPLQAQQGSVESVTTKTPEAPAEIQKDEKKADARTTQNGATDFRPSEEISEDLSVAFPVDI